MKLSTPSQPDFTEIAAQRYEFTRRQIRIRRALMEIETRANATNVVLGGFFGGKKLPRR